VFLVVHGRSRVRGLAGAGGRRRRVVRLQESTAAAIRLASGLAVRVADPNDQLSGNDPRNVVNRLTAGGANGVQIEGSSILGGHRRFPH